MLTFAGGAPARRTTDENSPVSFLAPEHPAMLIPNRISQSDFTNWVQERGTYYPSSWDTEKYTPLLALTDPGEDPNSGALLVGRQEQYIQRSREHRGGVPAATVWARATRLHATGGTR